MNTPIAVSTIFRRIVKFVFQPTRGGFAFFMMTVGLVLVAGQVRADLEVDTEIDQERLATYVGMFNELADRRRKVIYTDYPVSPYHGVVSNFVHVSDGSAAFARTDMVVDATMPIIIRRAYHSGRNTAGQFGDDGWRLTLDEQIRQTGNGKFEYRYGNGATLTFDKMGLLENRIDAFLSDVTRLRVRNNGNLRITTRTGLTKDFSFVGGMHRLSRVTDAHGNALTFKYDNTRLSRIRSTDGPSARLSYDALGRISVIQDSTGRRVSYAYDGNGRLSTVNDVREQDWQYVYSDSGRIAQTVTPNGQSDLVFQYDGRNRVTQLSKNGVPFNFSYSASGTIATDAVGRQTRFQADRRGITQRVINAAGTDTQIKFSSNGLPNKLVRNQKVISMLKYRSNGLAIPRQISIKEGGKPLKMKFDRLGRLGKVEAGRSDMSYRVTYGAGLAPVAIYRKSSGTTRISYDSRGEVGSFSDSGSMLMYRRNGNELQVSAPSGRSAKLQFNEFGQLERVTPSVGAAAYFAYDNDGFRRLTSTSDGVQVSYHYDSTGNLFSTSVSMNGQAPEIFSYLLSSHNRLDSIVTGDSVQAAFEYNASGLPVTTRSPLMIDLSFDYDNVGRLAAITPEGGAPLNYSYYPGEPDISIQLDNKTSQAVTQQKEISDFGSRMDVFLSRVSPSGLGYLTFDTSVQELKPFVDPRHWSPDLQVRNMIENTRMSDLLAEGGPVYSEFAKPSNRYFIPPELWAINCCFCCGINDGIHCEIP